MNTVKKLFSRKFYQSCIFWILFTLALYTAIGFLALPKIIHNTINEQVKEQLGWHTQIASINVNPFLFTLHIKQFSILDDTAQVISFSDFYADFELRSITEGAFTFKNISLRDPAFNLTIENDGSNNIQQALASHASSINNHKTSSPFIVPKLLFDNIIVENGSLSLNDFSQGELIHHQLNPISFKLSAFSTYIKKGGDYQLHISLDNQQSIDWSGKISVAPISSQGSFNIKGIRAHRLWAYLDKFSPYALLNSEADIQANYELSYIDETFQLKLEQTFVNLNDIKIAQKQTTQSFATINQIKIGPASFDLLEQQANIERVSIESLNLNLVRDTQGEIDLLLTLESFLDKNNHNTSSQPATKFLWAIDNIIVDNSQVKIMDNSVKGGATLKVHSINAELFSLNQSLRNKQPFLFSYHLNESQKNTFLGDVVIHPFKLNSQVILNEIPIKLIQPYLSEIANVNIEKGNLSLQGDTSVAFDEEKGLSGYFIGKMDVIDFDSSDTIIKRRLLGWQALSVAQMKINLSPFSVDIQNININKPYSRFIITQDRNINFSQLMINTEHNKNESISSNAPPKIDIAGITIKDGSAYFADLSLRPQFATSIQNMRGNIRGLSSTNLESANVAIKGSVEEYGKVSINGKINPLGGDLYTDINVNFDKIELTTLTPYASRYAGYVIDKGKLSLDLNYKISKGLLDGRNRLILDQFELGEAVQSEESLDLPIKLALALFKDNQGMIDISLPTKGNLNDPDFEISGLIVKALVNVMAKAISSPFSLLADLAGGDEQSLNSVAFKPGSTTLSTQQKSDLKTLSALLIKRPQLILEIRVNVDSEVESQVLKIKALQAKINTKTNNQQQQIQSMEVLLTELQGNQALDNIKKQLVSTEQQTQDELQLVKQYHHLLFEHLLILQPLSNFELTELAQQRISVIKHQLININKIDNQQVFALQPSLSGNVENSTIKTIFTLTSK